ncbi:MAG: hypothetical protein WDW38_009926 [Sanguina aurantia]
MAETESPKVTESPRSERNKHRAWQAGDPTITIHVKAGAEHKALLYLMCQINRHFGMDDVMPDPDGDAADFAFEVLRLPPGTHVNGDAATGFLEPTRPPELVVRRVRVHARDLLANPGPQRLDSTIILRRNALRTITTTKQHGPQCSTLPLLLPVALPKDEHYLSLASSIILEFNRRGMHITPYIDGTVRAIDAAIRIQAFWRAYRLPQQLRLHVHDPEDAGRRHHPTPLADIRLACLTQMSRLAKRVQNLLLSGTLVLSSLGCAVLRERCHSTIAAFPEQRLRFGFSTRSNRLILIEPEEPPAPTPAPLPPAAILTPVTGAAVADSRGGNVKLPERGLPRWLGCDLPVVSEREAREVHGVRDVLGRQQVLQLIISGTTWKASHSLSCVQLAAVKHTCSRDVNGKDVNGKDRLPDFPTLHKSPRQWGGPQFQSAAQAAEGWNEPKSSNHSYEAPPTPPLPSNDVLLVIGFPSLQEAVVRAALLLMFTWDCKRGMGSSLLPPHQTTMGFAGSESIALLNRPPSWQTHRRNQKVMTPSALLPMPTALDGEPVVWRHTSPPPPRSPDRREGRLIPIPATAPSPTRPRSSAPAAAQQLAAGQQQPLMTHAITLDPDMALHPHWPPAVVHAPFASTSTGPDPLHVWQQTTPANNSRGLPPVSARPELPGQHRPFPAQTLAPDPTPSPLPTNKPTNDAGRLSPPSPTHDMLGPWTAPPATSSPNTQPPAAAATCSTTPRLPPSAPTPTQTHRAGALAASGCPPPASAPTPPPAPPPPTDPQSPPHWIPPHSRSSGAIGIRQLRPTGLPAGAGAGATPPFPDADRDRSPVRGATAGSITSLSSSRPPSSTVPPPLEYQQSMPLGADAGIPETGIDFSTLSPPPPPPPAPPPPPEWLLLPVSWPVPAGCTPPAFVSSSALISSSPSVAAAERDSRPPPRDLTPPPPASWEAVIDYRRAPPMVGPSPGGCGVQPALPDAPEEVALGTVQHHQAAIQRLQHAMAQAHIDEGRQLTVTEKQERSVQLLNTTSMQQVAWRQMDTGHKFAPSYMPLSSSAMGEVVAAMQAIYTAAAAQVVVSITADHREAMAEVREEQALSRAVHQWVGRRQRRVAHELARHGSMSTGRAKQLRVLQARLRGERGERVAHEREFAAAFGRQVNALSKKLTKSEMGLRTARADQRAATQVHALREEDAATSAAIRAEHSARHLSNTMAAMHVRETLYTADVGALYETQHQAHVALVVSRRVVNRERYNRVGPAGGVWGSGRSPATLRQQLPLTSVVSAAEARRRQEAAEEEAELRTKTQELDLDAVDGEPGRSVPANGTGALGGGEGEEGGYGRWPQQQETVAEEEGLPWPVGWGAAAEADSWATGGLSGGRQPAANSSSGPGSGGGAFTHQPPGLSLGGMHTDALTPGSGGLGGLSDRVSTRMSEIPSLQQQQQPGSKGSARSSGPAPLSNRIGRPIGIVV